MIRRLAFVILLPLLGIGSAWAAETPDFISVGGGIYDFDKQMKGSQSGDYRFEYECGASLLSGFSTESAADDSFLQLHPVLGIEGNVHNAIYANGGLDLDVPFARHGILTWGEAVGFFGRGNDIRALGSAVEFRSQIELGWRFDNAIRLTGYISHISNAHLTNLNPGAEILGMYLHIPLRRAEDK